MNETRVFREKISTIITSKLIIRSHTSLDTMEIRLIIEIIHNFYDHANMINQPIMIT